MSSDPDPQHWGKKLPFLSCSIRAGLSPPPWVRFISESVSEGLPREPQGIAAIRRLDSIYRNKVGRGRTIYYTVISYYEYMVGMSDRCVMVHTIITCCALLFHTQLALYATYHIISSIRTRKRHSLPLRYCWTHVLSPKLACLGPKRRSVVLQEIWLEPMKMFNKKRYLVLKFPSLLGEISPF